MTKKKDTGDAFRETIEAQAKAASDAYDARQAAAEPPPPQTFVERCLDNWKQLVGNLGPGLPVNPGALVASAIITSTEALCERLDRFTSAVDLMSHNLEQIRGVFRE